MYGFSRFDLAGRFTRRVENRRFSVVAVIALLILAGILALLQFGQALTSPKVLFGEGMLVPWLSYGFTALIAAGFVGIGFGGRWAWFFPAAGALGLALYTATHPASRPDLGLFVYLFAYVVVLITSVYGFFAWGSPLPAATTAEEDGSDAATEDDDATGNAASGTTGSPRDPAQGGTGSVQDHEDEESHQA
jgi:hypothetical protein